MGHSVGRWEDDTLVVEVNELIGDTWFDRSGNFHSGGMTVTERYTPITPYHIDYEATITDPDVFTEPWTIKLPLYKRMEEHPQVLEYRCVEMGRRTHLWAPPERTTCFNIGKAIMDDVAAPW